MGLSDWLFGATPGQQAGQAVKEVVGGIFDGVDQIIDNFHLSEEKALELKLKFKQVELETYTKAIEDVQNARQMQVATQSIWPGLLSGVILLGFFGGGAYILTHGMANIQDDASRNIINMFAVQLMAGVSAVWGFWLGSSYGSHRKDEKPPAIIQGKG